MNITKQAGLGCIVIAAVLGGVIANWIKKDPPPKVEVVENNRDVEKPGVYVINKTGSSVALQCADANGKAMTFTVNPSNFYAYHGCK